ncbi:prepilin-type N-terminal cleavage/methylation domain-containing protein [Petrocella sp. FN5]|uniref:prepilin-type N-terminal cleavage/methylation domain-containing protein n=1 Tax=Petrocella sp. FN5 TaxID=3032002 RepID=UPI0023DC09A9|nr:hypothetical protein [Petrocella sp. FN5]MDF1617400.1 hypothetical protein [Petrocella sp. FN5]
MRTKIQKNQWKKKLVENQGFTLFELILAITLLFIIILATFTGLQFAFHTMASSKEFSENTYDIQSDYENELTKVRTYSNIEPSNQTIRFEWEGMTSLDDFDAIGIRIDKDTTGGSYLEETINMFIPVRTEP